MIERKELNAFLEIPLFSPPWVGFFRKVTTVSEVCQSFSCGAGCLSTGIVENWRSPMNRFSQEEGEGEFN